MESLKHTAHRQPAPRGTGAGRGKMLKIKNFETGETAPVVRDVSHQHPAWVHEQCGTASEAEFQQMLDQTSEAEYLKNPGAEDCAGVYWDGPVYHVEAWYEESGQVIGCSTAEVLGDACGILYGDLEEAKEAADELQSSVADYELNPATRYSVCEGSREVYVASRDDKDE